MAFNSFFLFFGKEKKLCPCIAHGFSREGNRLPKICLYNYTMCTRTKFPTKALARKCACRFPLALQISPRVVSRARHNLHRSRLQAPKPPSEIPLVFRRLSCFQERHAENSNGIRRDQKALLVTCRLGKVQKKPHGKRGPGRQETPLVRLSFVDPPRRSTNTANS